LNYARAGAATGAAGFLDLAETARSAKGICRDRPPRRTAASDPVSAPWLATRRGGERPALRRSIDAQKSC